MQRFKEFLEENSKLSPAQEKALAAINEKPFSEPYGGKAPNPKSGFHIKVLNSLSSKGLIHAKISDDNKTRTWYPGPHK
jgi:hypothetical protein